MKEHLMTVYSTLETPVGQLLLAGNGDVLSSVRFTDSVEVVPAGWRLVLDSFGEAKRQLDAYFDGSLHEFSLAMTSAGTPFQEGVWAAVDGIPYGKTVTYGEIAAQVGAPRDRIRAVAAAIGANPLLIVRPCHRVVGADGSLTGYAGGLERKHALLTLEGVLQPQLAL
jgi:methylated-DNA-[protein]-cysteine S-methyltransferase